MIEDLILDATSTLISQQRGKLINKALHTEKAASQFIPRKVLETINSHRKVGALTAIIPTVGMFGTLASVWHMYYSINQIIGIQFNKNLVKSIATGIASNMVGFFTASFILDKIPFANFLNAPVMYGATCVQGFVYIKVLTALNSTSGEDIDRVISNVIKENTDLIKKVLSEFFGGGNTVQSRQLVSLHTLAKRREQNAINKKKDALSQIKFVVISIVLGFIGLWYCSNNIAYSRDVTDIWITSFTSTSWNLWWYFWGTIILASTLIFLYSLVNMCFGFADYYKIKSTPLSQFAEKNEFLKAEKPLEKILRAELRSLRLNKITIVLSHFCIGLISAFLACQFFFYCATHASSEMITVKYMFMDATNENDTNYVWYIMFGSGLLTSIFALKCFYKFIETSFTLKMKGLMVGILLFVTAIIASLVYFVFYPNIDNPIYEYDLFYYLYYLLN